MGKLRANAANGVFKCWLDPAGLLAANTLTSKTGLLCLEYPQTQFSFIQSVIMLSVRQRVRMNESSFH